MRAAAIRTIGRARATIRLAVDNARGPRKVRAIVLFAALSPCERVPIQLPPPAAQPGFERGQAQQRGSRVVWRAKSDSALWASISRGGIAVVGLRAPGTNRGVVKGRVVIDECEQRSAERAVANLPGLAIVSRDNRLPILLIRIEDDAALARLRRMPEVDYIEADRDYSIPAWRVYQSTCRGAGFRGQQITVSPGDQFGGRANEHQIVQAWAQSNGSGVTIGLVDTGADPVQPQLHGEFDDGMSVGRTATDSYTRGSDYYDNCGHGTQMAGIMTAPRDGRNVVGVAWGANLLSVRAQDDPWADFFSVTQTRLGIAQAASRTRLVVLGFGTPGEGYSSIEDEIASWYYNADRLFVAPSGNFPNWCPPFECRVDVMFPARLSTVTAVTSTKCEDCIWGDEVDYHGHSGNPTTGAINIGHPEISSSSKTSGATAVIGGILALVWSKYPSFSRQQVLQKINSCGGSSQGAPNALCAVTDPAPDVSR